MLHYQNTSRSTIVFPIFSVLCGYELFKGEAAFDLNQKERSISLHRDNVLDATQLSKPDAKLFWILRSGETAQTYAELRIPLEFASRGGPSSVRLDHFTSRVGPFSLGGDHFIRVRMNPWPADRNVGEKLRELWKSYGVLWLNEVESLPLKLHVERWPHIDDCRSDID